MEGLRYRRPFPLCLPHPTHRTPSPVDICTTGCLFSVHLENHISSTDNEWNQQQHRQSAETVKCRLPTKWISKRCDVMPMAGNMSSGLIVEPQTESYVKKKNHLKRNAKNVPFFTMQTIYFGFFSAVVLAIIAASTADRVVSFFVQSNVLSFYWIESRKKYTELYSPILRAATKPTNVDDRSDLLPTAAATFLGTLFLLLFSFHLTYRQSIDIAAS